MKTLTFQLIFGGFYIVLDCLCIFLSVFLAYGAYQFLHLGKTIVYDTSFLLSMALILCGASCFIMYLFGAYFRESGILNVREIRGVMLGILTSFVAVNAVFFALRFLPSRYFVFLCFVFILLTIPLTRSVIYTFMASRLTGPLKRRVLIYGAGELGKRLYREIHNSPRLYIQVCGFVDDDPGKRNTDISPCGFQSGVFCRVLGDRHDLPGLIREYNIDEILIAVSNISSQRLNELFAICRKLNIEMAFVPYLHEIFVHRLALKRVGNLPLMREQRVLISCRFDLFKRILDLGVCFVISILLFPVMGLIALTIKLDSPGPVFFKQKRVGKDGRIFQMYKFRSMVADTPAYAVNPLNRDDPRITRAGRFLRKTSLDELPQIINVIRGEMSLVGPRPEMPFIAKKYNDVQKERLLVLPGITGLWQLSGDRKKPIHENMDYDLYYVYNRSFFLDLTILLQTLIFAFKGI